MAIYLVQHTHTADTCPSKNPEMVRQLSAHVTPENAGKYGVKLLADWANDSEHTVVLVLETDSWEKAEKFVQPFKTVGLVTIREGMSCQDVAKEALRVGV